MVPSNQSSHRLRLDLSSVELEAPINGTFQSKPHAGAQISLIRGAQSSHQWHLPIKAPQQRPNLSYLVELEAFHQWHLPIKAPRQCPDLSHLVELKASINGAFQSRLPLMAPRSLSSGGARSSQEWCPMLLDSLSDAPPEWGVVA
ncbi:hypothetical protein Nepgr_007084 [Nepenthes gracilis]|uniref:Uncharacterized protein n=1 Tax=Nepenthes gracilis TaxID=150966 RepID=A0AAD3S6J2_NEPGR|nr:hypothetical protein Nepgr_007084 [Nepenthes gracilis]